MSLLHLGLRDFLRELAHGPDRLLHPLRRLLARSVVGDLPSTTPILFVCHGNICRSPYAERSFRRLVLAAGKAVPETRSAGFTGPGRSPPREALSQARRRGVDLSTHRSQLLAPGLVRESGLIVVMDTFQRRALARLHGRGGWRVLALGDLDPLRISRREVKDPFAKDESTFAEVYERIDRCLGELVEILPTVRLENGSGEERNGS
jgi:protein-tyrosine phosphatase